jgi:hypothetical protein
LIGVRLHEYAARAAREACARSAVADAASTLAINAAEVGTLATVRAVVGTLALVAPALVALAALAATVATAATIAIARTAKVTPRVAPRVAPGVAPRVAPRVEPGVAPHAARRAVLENLQLRASEDVAARRSGAVVGTLAIAGAAKRVQARREHVAWACGEVPHDCTTEAMTELNVTADRCWHALGCAHASSAHRCTCGEEGRRRGEHLHARLCTRILRSCARRPERYLRRRPPRRRPRRVWGRAR